jgi:hypothetical protein
LTGEELTNEELVALLRRRLPDILLEGFPDISPDELVEQLRRQPDWLPDIALKKLITLVCEFVASKGGWGWVFLAARRDEKLARALCSMAGGLARNNEALKALLKEGMKPPPRRSEGGMLGALALYVYGLKEGWSPKRARWMVRLFERHRTGKLISDKTAQNILSEAAKTVSPKYLTDDMRATVEKRLSRGIKTRHRGW